MNYFLKQWTPQLSEYGDRYDIVAIGDNEATLAEFCAKKYGKAPVKEQPKGYDEYFTIEKTAVEMVVSGKKDIDVIDLNECEHGDILVSSHGAIFKYISKTSWKHYEYLDHVVQYVFDKNGKPFEGENFGTRTNDGFVFANHRLPEIDHDIVKILKPNKTIIEFTSKQGQEVCAGVLLRVTSSSWIVKLQGLSPKGGGELYDYEGKECELPTKYWNWKIL